MYMFVEDFALVHDDCHFPSIGNLDLHDVRTHRNAQRPFFYDQNPPFCPGSPQHPFMIRSSISWLHTISKNRSSAIQPNATKTLDENVKLILQVH